MRRTVPLAVALAAVLTTGLAACAGPSSSAAPKPEDSPLNKYMSAVWGGDLSPDEQQERFDEENKEREELVAACMAEEGFEYIPNVQNGGMVMASGDEWNPEDREWVAQYGYGMVNFPGRDDPVTDEQVWVDPNEDYIQSLSESEQAAYYETLHGPQPTEEELGEDGSYEYDWSKSGCYGAAQHETEQQNPALSDEFKPLMTAMEEFWTEMQDSDGFAELDEKWSACMADGGFPGYDKQADAQMEFSEKLNEYYENQTEWVEDDPELEKLGEEEIEVALVDLDCREDSDYRAGYSKVQFELEEAFIADHKDELDALKAAAEQGR